MKTLVVEDDPVSRKILTRHLAQFGAVETAENGALGVVKFIDRLSSEEPFDLVCLDIMMPEIDGQTCLKILRCVEEERGIFGLERTSVLMITSVEQPKDVIGTFKIGCDDYLLKPIDKQELITKIAAFQSRLSEKQ